MENIEAMLICNESTRNERRSHGEKRADYLSWDEYFMAVAFLSAQRSKDPRTQVGACIVNGENKIVGIGYNGMPIGCSDDIMPWGRDSDNILERKYLYVCHAEMNAILNKNAVDVKNCRIYVALFPCNECAKLIIQSGIKEVIYCSDKYAQKHAFQASRFLLSQAGIKVRHFESKRKQVIIDFGSLDELVNSTGHEESANPNSAPGMAEDQSGAFGVTQCGDRASDVTLVIQRLHVSADGDRAIKS